MSDNERSHRHLIINLFGEQLPISPPMFDPKLKVDPGNLEEYAPMGTGIYGYKEYDFDPKAAVHIHENEGGLIFFDDHVAREQLMATLAVMGVREDKQYLAFAKISEQPIVDNYLAELRLVSSMALRSHFGVGDQTKVQDMELTIPEAVWQFMEHQKHAPKASPDRFGTDGYWTMPALGFGFMIENSYFGIYRVWSRIWHVTR